MNQFQSEHKKQPSQQIVIESMGEGEAARADLQVIEGFTLKTDLILKSVLVGMWFYIVNNPVVSHTLARNFRALLDINLLQSIIFAIGFYIIFQFI
jgi:hypothetical protein